MDAFYAAVEQRDRPELRGKPVVVGADPRAGRGRGVVATASYEARRFGIGSAMPISQAWKRCPRAVYVRPDMEKYARASGEVFDLLRQFTDQVEPISIDEAFLDVTGSRRSLGDGRAAARALKDAIRKETRLTASVGVATSKLVAKIASDLEKPDGLVVVPPGTEEAFLAPLPVRRLWGVGPKLEEVLARSGVRTIGDLVRLGPRALERRLGTHGHDLLLLARGLDERPVVATPETAKSIGQEHTYDRDTADLEAMRHTLLDLSDGVGRRLRDHGLRGRTITLKYRDLDFETSTRAETLGTATDSSDALFQVAWRLLRSVHRGKPVRLLGVSASSLVPGVQLELFPTAPTPADQARDEVTRRFGEGALTRASLVPPPDAPRGRRRS